jgi:hypothetical protein
VGVAGGRMGFEALLLLGVDGPALLPFELGSTGSNATLFLFLAVLATFDGVDPFGRSSLTIEDAALKRADLLVDIALYLRILNAKNFDVGCGVKMEAR